MVPVTGKDSTFSIWIRPRIPQASINWALTNDADIADDGEAVVRQPLGSPGLQELGRHKLTEAPGVRLSLRETHIEHLSGFENPDLVEHGTGNL